MDLIEQWVDIEGYEGLYQISNQGRVKSLPRLRYTPNGSSYMTKEIILKVGMGTNTYHFVSLWKNNKSETKYVHRLVALHFIPKIKGKDFVNHIDENKLNNNVSNLEWCTDMENRHHGTGLARMGKAHGRKITDEVVTYDSVSEASRTTGKGRSTIWKYLTGRTEDPRGNEWRYL